MCCGFSLCVRALRDAASISTRFSFSWCVCCIFVWALRHSLILLFRCCRASYDVAARGACLPCSRCLLCPSTIWKLHCRVALVSYLVALE